MIRNATQKDVIQIMNLVKQAQAYFKSQAIDQWQDGYPNAEQINQDILKQNSYVLVDGNVIGTMYFAIEDDPTYLHIDGKWKTQDKPYAVIHRIVVDENIKGQGLAKQLLDYAEAKCLKQRVSSIRIDTHDDNLSMQRFLKKNGFEACGHITLESGALRIAFEKVL